MKMFLKTIQAMIYHYRKWIVALLGVMIILGLVVISLSGNSEKEPVEKKPAPSITQEEDLSEEDPSATLNGEIQLPDIDTELGLENIEYEGYIDRESSKEAPIIDPKDMNKVNWSDKVRTVRNSAEVSAIIAAFGPEVGASGPTMEKLRKYLTAGGVESAEDLLQGLYPQYTPSRPYTTKIHSIRPYDDATTGDRMIKIYLSRHHPATTVASVEDDHDHESEKGNHIDEHPDESGVGGASTYKMPEYNETMIISLRMMHDSPLIDNITVRTMEFG